MCQDHVRVRINEPVDQLALLAPVTGTVTMDKGNILDIYDQMI